MSSTSSELGLFPPAPRKYAADAALMRAAGLLRRELGTRLERIVLFGSRARGDAHEDSDYDLLLLIKDPFDWWKETRRANAALFDLMVETGRSFAVVVVSASDVQKRTGFYANVRRDGVAL